MTEAEQVAANVDRRHMKESDWASLVNQIKEHKLIPVLGPDLMRVPCGDGSITYERYIAQQLAQMPKYKLTDADFDRFGVTLNDATLNDVVSVLKKKYLEDWPFELHGQVWNIVNESPVPIPDALKQLAKITDFDLVVTSTFDPLMERALRERGPLETRIYRRSEKEDMADLPKDVGKRADRFLYYLFGRAEPGREDFPICDEELLRVLIKLHDAKYRPKRLFDALREKHLLLLGVNFSDWLARFFLWLAKDRGNVSLNRELREYVADPKVDQDKSLVLFLQHFSDTTVVVGDEPHDFMAELYRRWSGEKSSGVQPGSPDLMVAAEMPKGGVFISYSRSDKAAVEILYAKLRAAGIPAWYDARLTGGQRWPDKLRRYIDDCSSFVALVSMGALRRQEGEFRVEWKQAIERDARHFGTGTTNIIPIVIDDNDDALKEQQGMPPEFTQAQMYHCPRGEANQDLINCLLSRLHKTSGPEG